MRDEMREDEKKREFELDAAPGRDAYRPQETGRNPEDAARHDAARHDAAPSDVPVSGDAVGGVSGLAAGAAIGAVTGGPVGAVVGAAAGALAGVGVARSVDSLVNPEVEDAYWRENYHTRPYVSADRGYEFYRPAFRYGWESRARHGNRTYDEAEDELARDWDQRRGECSLSWDDARPAARDAWERVRL